MPFEKAIDQAGEHHNLQPRRRLTRSPHGMIAGVCAGLSDCFGINLIFVRIVFVSLGFLQGLGVVLYLILAVVIPARPSAETEALDRAPSFPPASPRKTLFAYIGGALSICATVVALAKDSQELYKYAQELYAAIVGPAVHEEPKPSSSPVAFSGKWQPQEVFDLQGSIKVYWLVGDVPHVAQINLLGTTGSASVRTHVLGQWYEHHQKIEVKITPQDVQLVGSEASNGYQPDIFHLYRGQNGTFTMDRVCDRNTRICFPIAKAEGNIQHR